MKCNKSDSILQKLTNGFTLEKVSKRFYLFLEI